MEIKALSGIMRKLGKASARTGITHTNAAALARVLTQPRNVQGISSILREEAQHPAALIDIRHVGSIQPARVEDLLLSLPFDHVPGLTDTVVQVEAVEIDEAGLFSVKEADQLIKVMTHLASQIGQKDYASQVIPTHLQHFNLAIRLQTEKIRGKLAELEINSFDSFTETQRHYFLMFMFDIKNDHSAFFHSLGLFQAFEQIFATEFSAWLQSRQPGEKFKILDIGPGLGEECYSLALVIAKAMVENHGQWQIADPAEYVEIVAIDHLYEPHVLDLVKQGHYYSYLKQEVPDEYYYPLILYRLLFAGEKTYAISPKVKQMVNFKRVDLFNSEERSPIFIPEHYQMVFCLRVLERLLIIAEELNSNSHRRTVKDLFSVIEGGRLLLPGGYFFGDGSGTRQKNSRLLKEIDMHYPSVNYSAFERVADFTEAKHGAIFKKKS